VQNEVPFFEQVTEMWLQCIPARAGDCHNVADGDPPMFTCIFDDLQGKLRQDGQNDLLPLHFPGKSLHLLLEGAEKVQHPWLPVRRIGSDGALGLSESEIIAFLAVLDDALKRAVRYVCVPEATREAPGA